MKMIICLGPICSGKTTWSYKFIEKNYDWYRFSMDEFKIMTCGHLTKEDLVYKMMNTALENMIYNLMPDNNIIIDGYFLNIEKLNRIQKYASEVQIIKFKTSLTTCLCRNLKRSTDRKFKISQSEVVRFYKESNKFFESKEFEKFINNEKINISTVNTGKNLKELSEENVLINQ